MKDGACSRWRPSTLNIPSSRHISTIRIKYSFVFVYMTTNCSLFSTRQKVDIRIGFNRFERPNTNESINWSAFRSRLFLANVVGIIIYFFSKLWKMISIYLWIFAPISKATQFIYPLTYIAKKNRMWIVNTWSVNSKQRWKQLKFRCSALR